MNTPDSDLYERALVEMRRLFLDALSDELDRLEKQEGIAVPCELRQWVKGVAM